MRWAPCFLASIPGTRWLRIKWRLKVVQSPGTTISVYHLRYTISAKLLIFSNAPAIGPQTHSSSYQNSQYETSSETAKIRYTIYFNAATGSFKLIAPNLLRVQCPRRFWEIDPEILHTCLMFPCQTVNECVPRFRQIIVLVISRGYLGLKGSHIQRKKRKNIRKGLGRSTLNTSAKFQGLFLKNGVDIWIFVR